MRLLCAYVTNFSLLNEPVKQPNLALILCSFFLGIANKELDGVVAYYCTKGISYQELFHLISDLLIELPFRMSVIICGLVCKYAI